MKAVIMFNRTLYLRCKSLCCQARIKLGKVMNSKSISHTVGYETASVTKAPNASLVLIV